MEYKVEMDKLTEEQLEAFRIINNAAVELELERRVRESTYEDEIEFMEDVSKAYFFLRPMYDNMRNNDTKKTITNSGIIETLEKFIRTAKANKIKYKEYESAPEKEPEQAPAPEKEPAEATKPAVWIISDIEKPEPIPASEPFSGPYKPVVQSKTVNDPYNPTPMPLRPLLQQESQPEVQPVQQPIPAPEPQPAPQPVAQSVPQSRLNEILANIPVVGN
jgi:hypothetical protein